jgi:hypothetical protein
MISLRASVQEINLWYLRTIKLHNLSKVVVRSSTHDVPVLENQVLIEVEYNENAEDAAPHAG